jgi:peptide subunit release factor 1 (eRF1)
VINDAEKNGVEMVFVSEESPYGRELLEGFGGIAALLRHRG